MRKKSNTRLTRSNSSVMSNNLIMTVIPQLGRDLSSIKMSKRVIRDTAKHYICHNDKNPTRFNAVVAF